MLKLSRINLINLKSKLILCVIFGVFLLSLSDNLYFFVDGEVGIWQYHCIRSTMIVGLLLLTAKMANINLIPKEFKRVFLRSVFNTLAIFCHFAGLSFLSVAEAGAGLFTAPIFVLMISWIFFSEKFSLLKLIAVILGTLGVGVLLQPDFKQLNFLLLFPVLAGFFYGLAVVTTKNWCSNESTLCLTTCYYFSFGFIGFIMTTAFHLISPETTYTETAKYFFVGWKPVDFNFLYWLLIQAILNVTAISLIIFAYQKIEASFLSIYEYFFLIFAAFWGWLLWSQTLELLKWIGIFLIIIAGLIISKNKKST